MTPGRTAELRHLPVLAPGDQCPQHADQHAGTVRGRSRTAMSHLDRASAELPPAMPMLDATDEQLLEVHMRSIRRRVLLVAVPVLAVSTAVGILGAAAPPAAASTATSP